MRITSSDFSRRLCAFSVFSARICHAISRLGTTSAVIDARAEPAHRLEPVHAVRRPEAFFGAVTAMIGSRNMPVRSRTSASRRWCACDRSRWNGVGSTLSIGRIATQHRLAAERIVVGPDELAAHALHAPRGLLRRPAQARRAATPRVLTLAFRAWPSSADAWPARASALTSLSPCPNSSNNRARGCGTVSHRNARPSATLPIGQVQCAGRFTDS